MAKIVPGPLISDIRGTAGGLTYSGNASGRYLKLKGTGPRTSSVNQRGVRSRWVQATGRWFDLSDSLRGDWNAFAADAAQVRFDVFGDAFFLPGISWYRMVNLWLSSVGRGMTNAVPTSSKPAIPTINTFSVTVGSSDVAEIAYTSGEFSGYDMVIKCGIRGIDTRLTQVASPLLVFTTTSPGATSQDFWPELEQAFGTIQAGWRVVAEVYRQSTDGYRGESYQISAVVQSV